MGTNDQDSKRGADASVENHALLIQLSDSFKAVVNKLDSHIASSETKSAAIHVRIDEVRDQLAAKGKLSSGSIFGFAGVFMTALLLIGGVMSAYVSVRLGNIIPIIDANTQANQYGESQRMEIRNTLHSFQLEAVDTDSRSRADREWIKESLIANRASIRELERHSPRSTPPP